MYWKSLLSNAHVLNWNINEITRVEYEKVVLLIK